MSTDHELDPAAADAGFPPEVTAAARADAALVALLAPAPAVVPLADLLEEYVDEAVELDDDALLPQAAKRKASTQN